MITRILRNPLYRAVGRRLDRKVAAEVELRIRGVLSGSREQPELAALIDSRIKAAVTELIEQHRSDTDYLRTPLVFTNPAKVHVHPTAVLNNALLNVESGEIHIEEYAFCGHNVCLLTGTHDVDARGLARQRAVPASGRDIVVRAGAWIGSNATVLGPAVIGTHAVVAAGAVVTGDVPDLAVVGGVPARLLRMLTPEVRENTE